MNQIERTLTSLEIAEMVGREHPKVMRDIRTIIEHLGGQSKSGQSDSGGQVKSYESYFLETTYTNLQNKVQPCFNLTKKGCELYATRMTGEKGTRFAVEYIERFNAMEQVIEQQIPQQPLELALQAALQHTREIKEIKTDIDFLKGSRRVDSLQQQEIQQAAKKSVVHALGGIDSIACQNVSKKAFSAFWNEFKRHFKIPRYGDIPKVKHDEALRFISLWRPSTSLQMEIDACNSQMSLQ